MTLLPQILDSIHRTGSEEVDREPRTESVDAMPSANVYIVKIGLLWSTIVVTSFVLAASKPL